MIDTPSQPLPPVVRRRPEVSFHALLLAMSAGVVFLSCVLRIAGDRQVLVPFIDLALPGTCTYQKLFGVGCPGCGLTRSFVSIGHGRLADAWRFNPAGLLGFALVATQIPYRIAQLRRLRQGKSELRYGWWGQTILFVFFALLMIQWLARTYFGT